MEELIKKYADVLLKVCLKVKENQPLLIRCNSERMDFVRIVTEIALEMGVKDIYFDITDEYIMHDALKELEVEDLKKLSLWDKSIWNEYASKNAAFLMLTSENPGLMNDIDPKKLSEMTKFSLETRKEFDNLRDKAMIQWTIAAVPTKSWADALFGSNEDSVEKLWDKILEICLIKEDNPQELWKEKINKLKERCNKLNNYKFTKLKYNNSIGTNFEISLPNNYIFSSGNSILTNNREVLVNYPTEEVFTSPTYDSANGIVYSAKPLSYQGKIIDNFYLKFKNGKVIESFAKENNDALKELVNICENSNMLGEVALVEYDSPISNQNIVFLETLFDENASCHLALGDSFPECIENGPNISKEDLFNNYKLNKCDSHTDFMIGTKDLNVIGITQDDKNVIIIKNGNFTQEFK